MNNVDVLPAARLEFREAIARYREQSASAARRFALEVKAAIASIRKHPDGYARIDETHRLYLLNKFPYYVAYRQKPGLVEIVAIRHAARDQDAWKGR